MCLYVRKLFILTKELICIVTDFIKALPGKGSVNTPRYTHTTIGLML
jgi:hypothetical protein